MNAPPRPPRARRLVVDLASPRAAWRVPAGRVAEIAAALGAGWELVEVRTPASADGDGAAGRGSVEAIAAATGAEIYVGYGIASGVAEAARETLRWVHSGTAGVASSLDHLRGRNILLTNSAGVHAEPMADWVIASVAYFARGLDRMVVAQREGRWAKEEFTDAPDAVRELRDIRMGILGLGGIGSAVARRAVALGMAVSGVRRNPARGAPAGVRLAGAGGIADLPRLAAESDCLVIAAPHTAETGGVVSRDVLRRLPPNALVVNVSRGSLLDDTALRELLDAGRLRGAALDVFATEPLPAGHPFWSHPRVLMSPHVSAVSGGPGGGRFWERETALIVDNIRRYLAGAPLTNLVDLEAGY